VTFELFEYLICAVDVLVLHVKKPVDEVLALKGSKAVLPAEAGCDRAVMERGLCVQIELRRPPCGCTVLKLKPIGVESLPPRCVP